MSSHAVAVAQAKNLEEISDENLIYYFKPELILIGEDQRATDLLPGSVIQKFVCTGVLESLKRPGGHTLTDKAMNILQEIHE